ncbi:DUF6754 domain-containing protein [Thermoproteota archaeon]
MALFVEGRLFAFAIIILVTALGVWSLEQAKRGVVHQVRTLPGIEAIDEAVKRCVELARPVFFTSDHGGGGVYSDKGPAHMAAISILGMLARSCARYGADLVTCHNHPEMVPLSEETVRQAYIMEGVPEQVKPEMFNFFAGEAFTPSYLGYLKRYNAGANIVVGPIWPSDGFQITEYGNYIGAIQIGGAIEISAMAMLATTCDYIFIAEELYVAGAYASEDPIQLAVTYAADLIKLGALILMIAGIILSSVGVDLTRLWSI